MVLLAISTTANCAIVEMCPVLYQAMSLAGVMRVFAGGFLVVAGFKLRRMPETQDISGELAYLWKIREKPASMLDSSSG